MKKLRANVPERQRQVPGWLFVIVELELHFGWLKERRNYLLLKVVFLVFGFWIDLSSQSLSISLCNPRICAIEWIAPCKGFEVARRALPNPSLSTDLQLLYPQC